MKHLTPILTVAITLIFTLLYNINIIAQSSSLLHQWNFEINNTDNLIEDIIGSNDGTYNGTEQHTDNSPEGNYAINLDGTDRWINCGTVNFGDYFTITGHYKHWYSSGNYPLLSNNENCDPNRNGFTVSMNTNAGLSFKTYDGSGNEFVANTSGTHSAGEWIYFAFVVNKPVGTCQIYINGIKSTQDSTIYTSFETNNILYLGAEYCIQQLWGYLDDIRIYNRQLTQSEITTISSGGYLTGDPVPNLEVSPGSLVFDFNSGNDIIYVNSNISWTVNDNQNWITVSPTSGSNSGSITVNVTENTTTSNRSGTVTVTDGSLTSTVQITQTGTVPSDYLNISSSELSFGSSVSSQNVNVTSNISWTVTDNQSWINVSPTSGSNSGTVAVDVEANPDPSSRSGTVTISGGGITRNLNVFQSGTIASSSPWQDITGGIGYNGAVGIGDYTGDNWLNIKQVSGDGFGYDFQYDNASVLINEQGASVNQALILGDVSNSENKVLFGVCQTSDGGASWTPRFTLTGMGRVGIGTITPAYELDVNGNINFSGQLLQNGSPVDIGGGGTGSPWLPGTGSISYIGDVVIDGKLTVKEVEVKLDVWADYVFKENYNLISLQEVEQFIKLNKHLPDVPSELNVKENGVALGEMNAILLQKIEELTLYIIQQNKTIESLMKEFNDFKNCKD
ncbi:MAG: hypothetical protein JXJ22_12295 [Bacteroidales bacterium]|nr:hypothetical protein [Bacteroidales bacterium]